MNEHADGATLSVLMPSYNPGRYLDEAIASVVAQLGPNDQLIVNDALSNDGSAEVFDRWSTQDQRIDVVREADQGQSDALNRCLQRARCEYCLWLNADDIVVSGAIAAARRAISTEPSLDLVVGANQILREDGSVVDVYPGRPLAVPWLVGHGCAAFSGSIVMRTELVRRIGGFDPHLNTMMDLELQLRLADSAPKQALIDDVVGALRFHEVSKSANLWREFVTESHRVRMQYARSGKDRVAAAACTLRHLIEVPIFRLRLTATYRRARNLVRAARN